MDAHTTRVLHISEGRTVHTNMKHMKVMRNRHKPEARHNWPILRANVVRELNTHILPVRAPFTLFNMH